MRFPFLPAANVEFEAHALLVRVFGADRIADPLVNLEVIVYDYLAEVENLSFDDESPLPAEGGEPVLGKTLPSSGKILIHGPLKEERPIGRYRFTVAHEIGHWILHRPLVLAARQQTSLFPPSEGFEFRSLNRSLSTLQNGLGSLPTEEWQANHFASALLIQPDLLRSEFRARFGEPPVPWRDGRVVRVPTLRLFARDLAHQRVRRKSPLHEVFGVSAEAMAVTLQQRELVVEK